MFVCAVVGVLECLKRISPLVDSTSAPKGRRRAFMDGQSTLSTCLKTDAVTTESEFSKTTMCQTRAGAMTLLVLPDPLAATRAVRAWMGKRLLRVSFCHGYRFMPSTPSAKPAGVISCSTLAGMALPFLARGLVAGLRLGMARKEAVGRRCA